MSISSNVDDIGDTKNKNPSVLCLLDFVLGNMIIHYSKMRVLHPRQGMEDILEVVREEKLLAGNIKLIYLLAGRADAHLGSGTVIQGMEKLLDGLIKINPKIMCVLGGIIMSPSDSPELMRNIGDINVRISKVASRDQHWQFFDPNLCIALAGVPQKRFYDKEEKINKAGCRFIAQALVAASKNARMLQNYGSLPPKIV